eukprot:scaffold141802_cov33-Tisochrysis_lutea.AAC.1
MPPLHPRARALRPRERAAMRQARHRPEISGGDDKHVRFRTHLSTMSILSGSQRFEQGDRWAKLAVPAAAARANVL